MVPLVESFAYDATARRPFERFIRSPFARKSIRNLPWVGNSHQLADLRPANRQGLMSRVQAAFGSGKQIKHRSDRCAASVKSRKREMLMGATGSQILFPTPNGFSARGPITEVLGGR